MPALSHRRILITRSREQASELARELEALGAETILIPTIELAPPESFAALDEAIRNLEHFHWLIFTSANAVQAFAARSNQQLPATLQLAVIGPATARAAEQRGFTVSLVPRTSIAESLAAELIPRLQPQSRVLLIRAADARNVLCEALAAAGAEVTIAEAYRKIVPKASVDALKRLLAESTLDAITFTSSSTALNLVELLEAAELPLPVNVVRASIGPITSQTLRSLGLSPTLEAAQATVASLAQSLAAHFASEPSSQPQPDSPP